MFLRNIVVFSRRFILLAPCTKSVPRALYNNSRHFSTSNRASMKIYTKTGDAGTSALFTGERRSKDDAVFEALGTIDELSASIGLAADLFSETHSCTDGVAVGNKSNLLMRFEKIQCCLQDIGSHVATMPSSEVKERLKAQVQFDEMLTEELECWIDEYTNRMPPLRNFILPGGSQSSSAVHVARAVCRRAERRLVPLLEHNVSESVYKYLNRLSDFLFTIARAVAQDAGKPERIYRRPKTKRDT